MLQPFWRLINVLLSLAAFFIVGIMALNAEEELVWAVCKAVGAFIICKIALNYMEAILFAVVDKEKPEEIEENLDLDSPDNDLSGIK